MSRQRTSEPWHVVIDGAGPVGCCAALYLAKHGFSVTLLEPEPALQMDLRASTFHPPTLDLMGRIGLTERLIPQGLVLREYQFRERSTGTSARFNLLHLRAETDHPYRLQCEQYKMTREVVKLLEQDLDTALDLYDVQRRQICIDVIQRQTIRNKQLLEGSNKDVQLEHQRMLTNAASDPVQQNAHLMESSMINCLRQSYAIGLPS